MASRKTQATAVDVGNALETEAVVETKASRNGPSGAAVVVEVVQDVPAPEIGECFISLIGASPLICHRWSDKAKRAMLDKQQRKASAGREAKDPERDYLESLYPFPEGGYGFPALAFKAAMVRGGSFVGEKMTVLRGAFHVLGELVKVEGEPRMREDMVRVGGGTADLRYRAEFPEWRVTLRIRYNRRVISEAQLLNLAQHAGFSVGVGEWRPEKDGSYGMFEVQRA